MTTSRQPKVLIVDDDPQVRNVFSQFLDRRYNVVSAASGGDALELIDDDVDVVVLDRRMPGLVGEDVLRLARDDGYDMPIALVTAVDPDFDVLEMGFDDYVVKPITPGELQSLVETLLLRRQYDDVIREYFELVSKASALATTKPSAELESHEGYRAAEARLEAIKDRARETLDEAIEAGKFDELFRESTTLERRSRGAIWPEAAELETIYADDSSGRFHD